MTPKNEVAKQDESALAVSQADLDAINAAQEGEFTEDDTIQVPLLKLGQALTAEVKAGDADAGDFINTLTNESYGDQVELIVAYYHRGRFASTDDDGSFVSSDDLIPEHWGPLVGDEFVGTPFAEYPDAEETYKKRVNNKEIEWGKGPLVSTTYNFTGFVVLPDEVVGEDAEITDRLMPVRLSLQRTGKKAADKIKTLKRAVLRNRPYWEQVISLRSDEREFGRNSAYIVDPNAVRFTRQTTAEEKALASQLALAVIHGRTNQAGDVEGDEEKAKSAAPEAAEGALDIG